MVAGAAQYDQACSKRGLAVPRSRGAGLPIEALAQSCARAARGRRLPVDLTRAPPTLRPAMARGAQRAASDRRRMSLGDGSVDGVMRIAEAGICAASVVMPDAVWGSMHGLEDRGSLVVTSLALVPLAARRPGRDHAARLQDFESALQSAAAPMSEENSAIGSASMARQ